MTDYKLLEQSDENGEDKILIAHPRPVRSWISYTLSFLLLSSLTLNFSHYIQSQGLSTTEESSRTPYGKLASIVTDVR
jgi:hypothetical protein